MACMRYCKTMQGLRCPLAITARNSICFLLNIFHWQIQWIAGGLWAGLLPEHSQIPLISRGVAHDKYWSDQSPATGKSKFSRLPDTSCDQLIVRRAELDEVKPTKYLWEILGRKALLEHSNLSNLILHFAIGVSLCPWYGHGCIHPGDQSCSVGTDLHSHPQPVHQDNAQNSGVTVLTKVRSDPNQSHGTFSPHSRHVTCELQMAASGLFWNLHLQKAKCPTGS